MDGRDDAPADPPGTPAPLGRSRALWLPLVASALAAAALTVWISEGLILSGICALVGVLVHLGTRAIEQRRALALEEGLAEAIGLATASLRAGASPLEALERAAQATAGPVRPILLRVIGRLRLGAAPELAFEGLAKDVPLESFRLLSVALAVQWRAGGSMDRSLSSVARAVRDRVELLRRIRTQSAPTRGSVFAFVAATAGIAFLMWQHDPGNLERFLRSGAGGALVGLSLWLQAIGIAWMWRLGQIEA